MTVRTLSLCQVSGKEVSECFQGSLWKHRHPAYDHWINQTQLNTGPCTITIVAIERDFTFAQELPRLLGVEQDIRELGALCIERDRCLTLPQVEKMVEKTVAGEKTGILTDCRRNFFPVKTGNPDDPIAIGDVSCVYGEWYAALSKIDYKTLWIGSHSFLLRNFKAVG